MSSDVVSQCDELQPWIAAYALGEADAAPDALAHLELCASCRHDLREYRAVAGLLPYDAPDHTPTPELRARLLAAISPAIQPNAAAQPRPIAAAGPAAPRLRRWPSLSRAAWSAYAFAALALALLGWNVTLQSQIATQANQIAGNRRDWQTMIVLLNDASLHWYSLAGQSANGHFWATPNGKVACLVAQQLPDLASDQVYQVWLNNGNTLISGGTFKARDGNAWILVDADEPLERYQAVFVTAEAAGGSDKPSGPRVLDGPLANGAAPTAFSRMQLRNLIFNYAEQSN